MNNMNTKQTILITGSSTGVGKAADKYFQLKGWNVIATMRTPEKELELTQLENIRQGAASHPGVLQIELVNPAHQYKITGTKP